MKQFQNFLVSSVGLRDVLILIFFTILITFNPYYLNDRINIFELGLYLPGINAIEHGLVPYRDFFHLRGPLDLYVPGLVLKFFGQDAGLLSFCFFFGNVLCLIFVVLIAKELITTRYMFYLMIPPIIARAFPRVVYPFWGGLRYAWGLLAVYCLIKFFKSKKSGWLIASGLIAAIAALISIEMGVYIAAAALVSLSVGAFSRWMSWEKTRNALVSFILAAIAGITPWLIYSISQNAFLPYLNDMWMVVSRMQVVIDPHNASTYPHNLSEALVAMTNTGHVNFKHMTPSYTYLFLLGFLIWRWYKQRWSVLELSLLALGVYGFIMYNTNFRGIWTAHFEMALMPQKILYFFLIESALLYLWAKKSDWIQWQKIVLYIVLVALFLASWGYALARYNNRFWFYQYAQRVLTGKSTNELRFKDKNEKYAIIHLKRADGIWAPVDQAEDLIQLEHFITQKTNPGDVFVMFPELGMYHFLFDRPFLGRFPITTFSWFNDQWFEEYLTAFQSGKAKYVVFQKNMSKAWDTVYLGYKPNRIKYAKMLQVIEEKYVQVAETPHTLILERK